MSSPLPVPSASGREQARSPDAADVTVHGFNVPQHPQRASVGPTLSPTRAGIRRKSSVAERLGSLSNMGGVNSFNNFARSWQRAAGFIEITPARRSFVMHEDGDGGEDVTDEALDVERGTRPGTSLLRAALENDGRKPHEVALLDAEGEDGSGAAQGSSKALRHTEPRQSLRHDGSFQIEPSIGSPFGGSFGTRYGSISSRVNESSLRQAGRMFNQQQALGTSQPDKEREPLLVRSQETEEGKYVNVVVGQSTLPQTIFNSVNVLIGAGMLSLPLGIHYSGWVIGIAFFTFATVATSYTAKLLAKCLDVDGSLLTFADLAYVSFGKSARVGVSILFVLELTGVCVALIILFADSLNALVTFGLTEWKVVCGIIILPLGFLPLRFLSFTSVAGIVCCMGIVVAVLVDGLIKPSAPGSLREPAATDVFPRDWRTLTLAFGLLMAPWGGHGVFPNIYRDMRHSKKYNKGVNITYIFTYIFEMALAIIGYLMFGHRVLDEITSNIFLTDGYPRWISILIVIAIAIIPLTKLPLNSRPLISTIEVFCGLDTRSMPSPSDLAGMSGFSRGLLKITIRVALPVALVLIAILVPSFDRVMALLGSLACFMICIVLPCAFHLKLFHNELSVKQKILDWTLLLFCLVLAVIGTVASFLPKTMLGVES